MKNSHPRSIKAAVLSIALLTAAWPAGAKVRYLTLAEKTREAQFILTGTIKSLAPDSVTVKVDKILKGAINSPEIQLGWDKEESIEKHAAKHKTGDEILIFANKNGSRFDPVAGSQGTLKLEKPEWRNEFDAAIKAITAYDSASSMDDKRAAVAAMLKGDNRLLQDAALGDLIYRNPDAKRLGLVSDSTMPDIVRLAKGHDRDVAIRATEVLAHFGGKDSVPDLIELVGSEHGSVAEVASRSLSQRTGVSKQVNWKQSSSDRAKVQREWQEWWDANKEKVKLRP